MSFRSIAMPDAMFMAAMLPEPTLMVPMLLEPMFIFLRGYKCVPGCGPAYGAPSQRRCQAEAPLRRALLGMETKRPRAPRARILRWPPWRVAGPQRDGQHERVC